MSHNTDFTTLNARQIAESLGERLADIRLSQNRTQSQIAGEAGISRATLVRLEQGNGVSFDSFIRVIMALKLHEHLAQLLPDPSIRPLDRVALAGRERQRARPKHDREPKDSWTWSSEDE